MFQFNPYYNNWLDVSGIWDHQDSEVVYHGVNLNLDFFNQIQYDQQSLKQYRTIAVENILKELGNKPALAISGGVDSQAMLQCFIENNVDFDAYVCKFNDDLNSQDVEYAKFIGKVNNIHIKEIDFNIINFLVRENYDVGIKYQSASPHFNAHYKFYDILFDLGHSGICAGGNIPDCVNNDYGINFDRNPLTYIQYSRISQRICHGSFLSYYPQLSWAVSLLTKPIFTDYINARQDIETKDKMSEFKYTNKLEGYYRAGFNVIRQKQKYTGFEKVKAYFEKQTGNGWEFEQRFRYPLEKLFFKNALFKFKFADDLQTKILAIHNNNFASTI